jgi:hypothetical protein
MAQVAQDTFVAELSDGSSLRVTRGSTWADKHEVVRLDKGRGHLFKPLDIDEPAADAPKSEAEPDPAPDPGPDPEVAPDPEPDASPAAAAKPGDAAGPGPGAAPVTPARPRRGGKAAS